MENKKTSRSLERLKETWRRFKKNKIAVIGLIIFTIILLSAIFADLIVPYENAITPHAKERLQAPSKAHIFGTDEFGRDLFARIIHGAGNSLFIGITVSVSSLLVGGGLGICCGYFGGKFDNIVMRILDMISALPGSLLSIVTVAVLGPSMKNLIIAMTVGRIAGSARMCRSVVLSISDQEYVKAAKAGGSGDLRIILRHAVPNASGTLIINTTMSMASVILVACSLSFIGLGVQPPNPEWGALLNTARQYYNNSPYLMFYPGMAILLTSISINMMGDGLRDALDPKLKS